MSYKFIHEFSIRSCRSQLTLSNQVTENQDDSLENPRNRITYIGEKSLSVLFEPCKFLRKRLYIYSFGICVELLSWLAVRHKRKETKFL